MILHYDESELVARLELLDLSGRIAFAAGCAQWLFPLFERYALTIGDPELSDRLGFMISKVWEAAEGGASISDSMRSQSEAMVPDGDDSCTLEMGYGEDAACAAAYAVRTALNGQVQEAAWAARNVYEVADYAVLQADPGFDLNAPGAESQVLGSPVVQAALMTIRCILEAVESRGSGYGSLREYCESGGRTWAASLP